MVPLGRLQVGDDVAVLAFEGVPYDKPGDDILVDETVLRDKLNELGKGEEGNAVGQIINGLKRHNLLPVRLNSVTIRLSVQDTWVCFWRWLHTF